MKVEASSKPVLLVVGDFCRKDFLLNFIDARKEFKIYFIEYSYSGELKNEWYQEYGDVLFWKDFLNGQQLLRKIKPKAVLFFFIESLNHVALLNSCKVSSIRTYHLEHGFRDFLLLQYLKSKGISFNQTSIVKKIPFGVRLRTRLFFEWTRVVLPSQNRSFLNQYKRIRLSNDIFDTFRIVKNNLRIADEYISISPAIFRFHQQTDHLPDTYPVHFIGLPYFDYIIFDHSLRLDKKNKKILFIDSGFHIEESFGWTVSERKNFFIRLQNIINETGYELWVKKHPLDQTDFFSGKEWNCINEANWRESYRDFDIITGEYSTLMIPIAALSQTVCFCFEMHPVTGYKVSEFMIRDGVASEINSFNQFREILSSNEKLIEIYNKQLMSKDSFLRKWLTVLDGKSAKRLTKVISGNMEFPG